MNLREHFRRFALNFVGSDEHTPLLPQILGGYLHSADELHAFFCISAVQ